MPLIAVLGGSVGYVGGVLVPGLEALGGEEGRFHALGEQAFRFGKVDDADFDSSFVRVAHTESKPLEEAAPVGIVTHPDVILVLAYLEHLLTVGTFKICVKNNRLIYWVLLVIQVILQVDFFKIRNSVRLFLPFYFNYFLYLFV